MLISLFTVHGTNLYGCKSLDVPPEEEKVTTDQPFNTTSYDMTTYRSTTTTKAHPYELSNNELITVRVCSYIFLAINISLHLAATRARYNMTQAPEPFKLAIRKKFCS